MVTRKLPFGKREHAYVFTFKSAGRLGFDEASALPVQRHAAGAALKPSKTAGSTAGREAVFLPRILRKASGGAAAMIDAVTKPKTKVKTKTERPRLHKVILVNDDYTPREFVVTVLMAEFSMTDDHAHKVMITAHQRGVCVVAVFTRDVAETKATRATDAGRAKGYPLLFTTEPEE
jgi:ATP-dependent Clp protease adaptor protein ClpS